MITLPSCSRLVEIVALELRTTIIPALSDPALVAKLEMIDSILHGVAIRCDNESRWMGEEIDQIRRLATDLIDSGADGAGFISLALGELRRTDEAQPDDRRAAYDAAGELLSVCLEGALSVGGDARLQAVEVLRARLATELEILGPFALVGRT